MSDKNEKLPTEKPKIETSLTVTGGLVPKDFDGLYRFCTILAASGLMPKGLERVEAVFVAVQMGMEVGLSPMQAVQNIAPINGRPAIWGDAVLGLVRASGLLESFSETTEGSYQNDDFRAVCKALRKGEKEPIVKEFSIADAKQAGLWCQGTHNEKLKYTPWYKYPKRMLQMRARSWALRDGFGDVLKGLRVAEEVLDYDLNLVRASSGTYKVNGSDTSDLSEKIKQQKAEEKQPTKNVDEEQTEPEKTETVEENKYEPDLQKMEQGFEENSEEFFRARWINMKEPGYSSFVYKNRAKFDGISDELLREAIAKWQKLYTRVPWPLNNPVEADNEDEKVQMINAISEFYEPEDVTKALHEHDQETLTGCDMEMLRNIHKYLRENDGGNDLA